MKVRPAQKLQIYSSRFGLRQGTLFAVCIENYYCLYTDVVKMKIILPLKSGNLKPSPNVFGSEIS